MVGRISPGVVSSVPPGQHAGNLDLRELTEGSTLYIPVWQDGAKIYTGDSHALQGDGEVNLTGLEATRSSSCRSERGSAASMRMRCAALPQVSASLRWST